MQHCRTTYGKALLLSVIFHIAVVGSAIAFAQYGGTFFSRDFRSITVSLVGNNDQGRPGSVPQAQKKKVVSVPVPEAPNQEVKSDLPEEGDLSHLSHQVVPAAGGSEHGEESAGEGQRSPAPIGDGRGLAGDISLEQWQLIQAALEKAKIYPRVARERGIEGVVLVRFKVLPSGEIERVDIIKSSGSDILDTASVRTVYRAAPMPYVNGWIDAPISYVLK
jgi:TonB family protein